MQMRNDISDSREREAYDALALRALKGLPAAYAPYSGFHVSAALLCADGTVYDGVNVENSAYSAGICAERTAIFKAVSEGKKEFSAIAVTGCHKEWLEKDAYSSRLELPDYCPPCGVCRQVMREFGAPEEFRIILAKGPAEYKVYKLSELLFDSFGPENL